MIFLIILSYEGIKIFPNSSILLIFLNKVSFLLLMLFNRFLMFFHFLNKNQREFFVIYHVFNLHFESILMLICISGSSFQNIKISSCLLFNVIFFNQHFQFFLIQIGLFFCFTNWLLLILRSKRYLDFYLSFLRKFQTYE